MKKYIILSYCMLMGNLVYSQENLDFTKNKAFISEKVNFETSSFQIENKTFLKVYGANPNSMIYCYNEPQGGTLIKRVKTNAKGSVELEFEFENSPSFILNSKNSIDGSAKGSGKVQYLDQKDFIVKNIELTKYDNKLVLNFESLVNPKKEVSYELVSQNEIGEVKTIHAFETNIDKEWEVIDFEYNLEPRTKYRFVVKSQGKERFSKEVYNSEGQNDFVVFPKMAEDFITVEFKKAIEHSTYRIVDSKGIVHSTGEVLDMSTQIEIGDLSAGSYFIRLDKYPKDAENFTKL